MCTHTSRPPHGGRGLKCVCAFSPPPVFSRPPHGGRGLKFLSWRVPPLFERRPPHGGRGLKYQQAQCPLHGLWSSSTRRTWIEIPPWKAWAISPPCRPPHGGRGLKFLSSRVCQWEGTSSSTRRTWIEIVSRYDPSTGEVVVLHTEDVD